jgi:glycine cleavage system T protein (aminomethyltransferase)
MTETQSLPATLATTPLHALHLARGARMVPFAAYEMPVQYEGIIAEHLHTRAAAGLFDVSHMGQAFLTGPDHDTTARALERSVGADLVDLGPGRQRYTQLLNEEGGIIDDLMVTRSADPDEDGVLMLVVNAARKAVDYEQVERALPPNVKLLRAEHRALIALQGPSAAAVLARHAPDTATMAFMSANTTRFDGIECQVSRSGYTGEDGYEISVNAIRIRAIVERLLAHPEVKLIGLGARDLLRLEAALCLYGHDIDASTSPVEAGLAWSIGKRRRQEGGFPGASRILDELQRGADRRRVGLEMGGRIPAREGAEILVEGAAIGKVTSGGFGPSLGRPIAMGYVDARFATPGTAVIVSVRGKELPARIVPMPFVPHRYYRA